MILTDTSCEPYYQDDSVTIYHGDCREILPSLRVGATVTDPPFNVGKDYGTHQDDLSESEYDELLRLISEVSATQAWVTPTVQLSRFTSILGADAHPVVVRRGAQGPIRFGWSDQFLLLLVRGKPLKAVSNLWDGIRLPDEGYFYRGENYGHPGTTAEPVMARLIEVLTEPPSVILDPFLGSGTTLRAAKNLNRKAIGIEIEEKYCEIAANRMSQEVFDFTKGTAPRIDAFEARKSEL